MRKLLLAAALACGLGGCDGQLKNAWDTLTATSVPPKAVIIAANSFDALEATATNYLRLPTCSTSSGPVCKSKAAVPAIIRAVRSGLVARNNLEQFLVDHPGALGPKGLYDALVNASATLQSIYAQYKVGA